MAMLGDKPQNGYATVLIGAVVLLSLGVLIIFLIGRGSSNEEAITPAIDSPSLDQDGYWRLPDWQNLEPGELTDPNPGRCDPETEYTDTRGHVGATHHCLARPPAAEAEEVVGMASVQALDRFNLDDKQMAMRIISSYVSPMVSFVYRPETPETCRVYKTYQPEDSNRQTAFGDGETSRFNQNSVLVTRGEYVISENCGDWSLDLDDLRINYGPGFFYEDPLDSFNADSTDGPGIQPVIVVNDSKLTFGLDQGFSLSTDPAVFIYKPSTPETCRYYMADSSYSRQAVDEFFDLNSIDGVRRDRLFIQNTDAGGWYEYSDPVSINPADHGYVFMIAENCGDWTRLGLEDQPDKNQIFDHPYETDDLTQTSGFKVD